MKFMLAAKRAAFVVAMGQLYAGRGND